MAKQSNVKLYIRKEEKQGIYTILILLAISWGAMLIPFPYFGFISWMAMGIIMFSLWRIIEGLLDREKEVKQNE